ncbi:hypothetical protein E4T38_05086 [Aureobasidium subglaciale]|nr:hypothetical protein E4T38_05086 [Aureobasidium subglaciale]KAI5222108.1 hypothetical protein E4T40_05124 [Aureobasidium subglaciale]KAI5225940.1 hypothetical protein E4T41_04943 [Aureobasidium subglaciale]KAI5261941.1 hypothetical protein E4T46_04836 [Aureobasidium subglaciale]
MEFNTQPAVQDPRFAADDTTTSSIKQVLDNDSSATSATRQHVNIDQQCGVPLFNGIPCASALTCQSHNLPAKRAVPGRSAPLDQLLARQQQEMAQTAQRGASNANINAFPPPLVSCKS